MENRIILSTLQRIDLFKNLSLEEFMHLSHESSFQSTPPYSFFTNNYDEKETIFIITEGNVKLYTISLDGKEIIWSIKNPVSIFGLLNLTQNTKENEIIQAMDQKVQFIALPVTALKIIMKNNFNFSMQIMKTITERLLKTEERLQSLIFKDARARIIDFLKRRAKNFGKKIGFETLIRHNLTQQEIANITDTSRQTVTTVLNSLKSDNLIYFTRKKILIRDVENLA